MEVRESGVTVVRSDAPSEYHIAPRTENSVPVGNPTPPAAELGKKKRGRPRKYLPDGSLNPAVSPKPISSSVASPVIDFSAAKRGKVRPASSVSKAKYEMENIGEWVACSAGANFTPHIITVNSGEDVTTKILSFSQHGPRTICVLSANGVISSVTLRQPDSSGGTLTYEGRFEILSLSGSFTPNETGGTRSRTGGMSVSLASPDGRVVGGGIAGLLVAASPVQVVVGSFLSGNQQEQKPKKQKHDFTSTSPPAAAVPVSGDNAKSNFPNSSPFRGDNWSLPPLDSRSKPTDINISLPGEIV